MIINIIFVICIFLVIWQGILFIGNCCNGTLAKGFPVFNILLLALSLTGVITHIIGIW